MHDHKCIPAATESPICTAPQRPGWEGLSRAPTLVRICTSPTYNEGKAEYFGKIGHYKKKKKKILFHYLRSKGEKWAHYFDIIKISFVRSANLPWPELDNSPCE